MCKFYRYEICISSYGIYSIFLYVVILFAFKYAHKVCITLIKVRCNLIPYLKKMHTKLNKFKYEF